MNLLCARSSWRGFQLFLEKQASLPACFGQLVFWPIVTGFLLITSPSLFAQTNDNTDPAGRRIAGRARTAALPDNAKTVRGRVSDASGAVAGAAVTLGNLATGLELVVTTVSSIPPVSPINTANGKADVWPGFRGAGNSHTAARESPLVWADDKNVAWNAALPGHGQSSPVVWRDKVFLTAVDWK